MMRKLDQAPGYLKAAHGFSTVLIFYIWWIRGFAQEDRKLETAKTWGSNNAFIVVTMHQYAI
jgi:hypothetical protein